MPPFVQAPRLPLAVVNGHKRARNENFIITRNKATGRFAPRHPQKPYTVLKVNGTNPGGIKDFRGNGGFVATPLARRIAANRQLYLNNRNSDNQANLSTRFIRRYGRPIHFYPKGGRKY